MESKINERTWSGHLVSWIKEAVVSGTTIFQDATNDQGVKMESRVTKFPDILLFTDKVSGTVFNGWELKFPDTAVDDSKMLENALEKAKTLRSNSFVTWNGTEAIIWKIPEGDFSSIQNLKRLKHYPKEAGINRRADLEDWTSYQKHEPALKSRLLDILADLNNLLESGEIKEALSISETFVEAIKQASEIIIPQFRDEIKRLKGDDKSFRDQFNRWTVYERSTLDILGSSSRKEVVLDEEGVLAKFTFYNLIGKIIFYSTLAANLPANLHRFNFSSQKNLKEELEKYFEVAKAIDYQAVFQPYFTDVVSFSPRVEKTVFDLLTIFEGFDFRRLPTEVIGTVLENLVPNDEKQKFGQYFTPQDLANFVAFPAIKTTYDLVFDPTSGTGTFLNSAYEILKYLGNENHGALLSQIWGNDISHFPAILSVINLYKQNPKEVDNFPRVIRDDFFNLEVGRKIDFPDSKNFTKKEVSIPRFNSIVSNFPFVQQEDIPDNEFKLFRQNFEKEQKAILKEKSFKLNERADYFTYCIYHAHKFLDAGGVLSAITSNAWLGKEYGSQFKRFLLDNFTIKYIIKTEAEHWFKSSKVITLITVLERGKSEGPTKFVTLGKKLESYFGGEKIQERLKKIEQFYAEVDLCNDAKNKRWTGDPNLPGVYIKNDGSVKVSVVPRSMLIATFSSHDNWKAFFDSQNLFASFEKYWAKDISKIYKSARGERTGWNPMFIIPANEIKASGIEDVFLRPFIKGPRELGGIDTEKHGYQNYLFVCHLPIDEIQANYPGAYKWIKKFENQPNTNKKKTIAEACGENNRPFWYSTKPKMFNLITSINPEERFFFTFSKEGFMVDQRLIAFMVTPKYDSELIAALLNCTITYLWIEMRGTARYEGVLDLNANDFKELKLLNPDLLDVKKVTDIKKRFALLKKRAVLNISQEVKQPDRIAFDKVIFKAFGIDEKLTRVVYEILAREVKNRIEMKKR